MLAVKSLMSDKPFWISTISLRTSGGIEQFTGAFDNAAEYRVFHCLFGDNVNWSLENRLQTKCKSHVAIGDTGGFRVVKVNHDINVTM